jgi:hypothetical protein
MDVDHIKNNLKLFSFSRPLEEYIRSVEKVFRTADKNPKKGLLSIAMNDHISKTTSQDQEGMFLNVRKCSVLYINLSFDSRLLHLKNDISIINA